MKRALLVIAGIFFIAFGALHFYGTNQMSFFVPLPWGSKLFVMLNGILLIGSGLAIALNKQLRLALLVIAITLSLSALFVQVPVSWRLEDIIRDVTLANLAKLFIAIVVLLFYGNTQKDK